MVAVDFYVGRLETSTLQFLLLWFYLSQFEQFSDLGSLGIQIATLVVISWRCALRLVKIAIG